jgi:hypothetical protein
MLFVENKMFRKINEGRVESDSGIVIQFFDLEELLYKEGQHKLKLEWNYDPEKRKRLIYVSKLRLGKIEKNIIKENILEAVKLLKDDFEIV